MMPESDPIKTISLLETRQLECVREDRMLFSGLSLNLAVGELLHFEGANCRGNTRMLRLLCGIHLPEEGEVQWEGAGFTVCWHDYSQW